MLLFFLQAEDGIRDLVRSRGLGDVYKRQLLLLDEPSNDLDVETLGSLENALLEFPGCAVVISHDRWFLDRVATHILAYEGDEEDPAKWYWFEGNFEACLLYTSPSPRDRTRSRMPSSA